MNTSGSLLWWRPLGFGNAVLLVVGLPMSLQTIPATVQHKATPGTGRKLGGTGTAFRGQEVATNLSAVDKTFLSVVFYTLVVI